MRPFSRLLQVFFAVFAGIADAALVNVTVDDAVLVGPVVPQYLPSTANWNAVVNNCTSCLVKPDPAQAYNHTWHDTTYDPSNGFTQVIEFTFTGSAVYIFFIIANLVPGATTLTDVQFALDQVTVGRYTHSPTTSTDYQYNVAVYSNNSLALGSHNMNIQPVVTGNNNVLMLFDYLIYTIDTPSSVSSSPTGTTATLLPSSTSSGAGKSSPNIGAIVGASVGGVALVGAALLCYRRHHKRRGRDQLKESDMMNLDDEPEEAAVVNPFILSHDEVTAPIVDATATSAHPVASSVPEPTSKFRLGASSAAALPSTNQPAPTSPPSSTATSSPATSSRGDPLREQVQLLRDEVARIREHQHSSLDVFELSPREPPPSYS